MNAIAMPQTSFDEAASAHAKVKEAVATLRADYDSTCAEIETAEAELAALPLSPVPFEDMKAAILELVDASSKRYADNHVRKAISTFATGGMGGIGGDAKQLGKPLRFADIEAAINGENSSSGRAQFASYSVGAFDDQALYFFFGDLVREGLRRVMDDMTPEEFGYSAIHPDKIGSGLADRRKAIEGAEARLEELRAKRADLVGKLAALGYHVAPTLKH